ncbi:Histone deacetylase 4 [Taenia solium]|eukprot:TsM_000840500 transcript=TsM_000840500 gene=TsM_000840500
MIHGDYIYNEDAKTLEHFQIIDLMDPFRNLTDVHCLESGGSAKQTWFMLPFEQSTEFTTVLAYDVGMLAHRCTCQIDANHPENPSRLVAIWQRIQAIRQACLKDVVVGILGLAAGYVGVGDQAHRFLEILMN